MSCLWKDIDLGWTFGDIHKMSKEAIRIAGLLDTRCTFSFNGISVSVHKYSDPSLVSTAALECVDLGKDYFDPENRWSN